MGNSIWPIKWQQRQWPWMTLKVIHRLQAFSNAILWTFVRHFTQFQLTVCLHGSSALAELLVCCSKVVHNMLDLGVALLVCVSVWMICAGHDDIYLRVHCWVLVTVWDRETRARADQVQHWYTQCRCQPARVASCWAEAMQDVWGTLQNSVQISGTGVYIICNILLRFRVSMHLCIASSNWQCHAAQYAIFSFVWLTGLPHEFRLFEVISYVAV